MILTGENQSTRGESCPSVTLSTTNPTLTGLGSNLGVRGENSAIKHLSHDTAVGIWICALWAVTCVDGESISPPYVGESNNQY
jgi:hypothetical protein